MRRCSLRAARSRRAAAGRCRRRACSAASASVLSGRVTQRTATSVIATTATSNTPRLRSSRYGQLAVSSGGRESNVTSVPSGRRAWTTNEMPPGARDPGPCRRRHLAGPEPVMPPRGPAIGPAPGPPRASAHRAGRPPSGDIDRPSGHSSRRKRRRTPAKRAAWSAFSSASCAARAAAASSEIRSAGESMTAAILRAFHRHQRIEQLARCRRCAAPSACRSSAA